MELNATTKVLMLDLFRIHLSAAAAADKLLKVIDVRAGPEKGPYNLIFTIHGQRCALLNGRNRLRLRYGKKQELYKKAVHRSIPDVVMTVHHL